MSIKVPPDGVNSAIVVVDLSANFSAVLASLAIRAVGRVPVVILAASRSGISTATSDSVPVIWPSVSNVTLEAVPAVTGCRD